MQNIKKRAEEIFTALFNQAETQSGLEYIFTLVRVTGITCNIQDPFLALRSKMKRYNLKIKRKDNTLSIYDYVSMYWSLTKCHEVLALIANLINCSVSKPFNPNPFQHLVKGRFPSFKYPTTSEVARELVKLANNEGKDKIASLIEEAYLEEALSLRIYEYNAEADVIIQEVVNKYITILSILLKIYFEKRLIFNKFPKYHKLPRFEVLEILLDDAFGLSGFKIHFSNGSHAKFLRNKDSTECMNVILRTPINFMAGLLDALKDEWRIGDKRLYEIGLPGRYNKPGEWKPIIYPGKWDMLENEARKLSDDTNVQGILFYMMCTGHRAIEFVMWTTIDLPSEYIRFGDSFYLYKCPVAEEPSKSVQNFRIYDGTLIIENVEPEHILSAIATIGVAVNRIAFAYEGSVHWRLKYDNLVSEKGCPTPEEEDLKLLESIFSIFPDEQDAELLEAAIDWFNRGQTARNIFTSYLCYYISIESVAIAIAEQRVSLGLVIEKEKKNDEKIEMNECIEQKYNELFAKSPKKFVIDAYFDCVISLRKKVQKVIELVFGKDHPYVNLMFKEKNGYSLSDIRSKIAHGGITLLDRDSEKLVRSRIGDMAQVSRDFLFRLIFSLNPKEKIPTWSRRHLAALNFSDPRNTLVSTHEHIFPNKNWKIRPEWCF